MRRADPVKLDLVRDEILRAAMGLFQKYGIDKTTMEDIAEAAGKGKSTLYYYFKKKEEVFSAVAHREISAMLSDLEKGLNSRKTAAEKVRFFFTTQDTEFRSKLKLYPMVFKETNRHLPLFHSLQSFGNTRQTEIFKSILQEGIRSGEFKSIRTEECTAIAITIVATLHAMQLTLLLDGKPPSDKDKISVMMDILVRGLK